MASKRMHQLLAIACVCALAALALMSWQLFDPYAFPVIIGMSVGQALGTASFVAYALVVLADSRRLRLAARRGGYVSERPSAPDTTGDDATGE
ncbi:MAG TPA: hypothetical protein VF765_15800 [Polyangiaceae bacterium]